MGYWMMLAIPCVILIFTTLIVPAINGPKEYELKEKHQGLKDRMHSIKVGDRKDMAREFQRR